MDFQLPPFEGGKSRGLQTFADQAFLNFITAVFLFFFGYLKRIDFPDLKRHMNLSLVK